VSRGTLPLFLYSFHWLPWTLYMLTVCVCGTVTDVETNPLTHSLSGLGRCSSPAHWQYYGINAIFYISWPLCSSTIVPKSIHFHRVINFLGKCAFLDLADFWLIFRYFERVEVCAFISRKLNKLRGPLFTFPDNVTPSILIVKKVPPRIKFRGL